MSFTEKFAKAYKSLLPAPFTIAVILTVFTYFLALYFTSPPSEGCHSLQLLQFWEEGLWNNGLMVFALQMMLMLVLGHVLALTRPANRLIQYAVQHCKTTGSAAAIVSFLTMSVAFFNWGLGLIFGAIFARKVAEYAAKNNIQFNYPVVGAAGYSGLMVWHGGLSGSSLVKAAEQGHIKNMMEGIYSSAQIEMLPDSITFSETVFSTMNISVSALLLLVIPVGMYFLGRATASVPLKLHTSSLEKDITDPQHIKGAERLDYSRFFALFFGGVILLYASYKALSMPGTGLSFITPNFINFILLGLGVVLHGNFHRFLHAVDSAISGASGILIQFPLYFGIMGIMKSSGLVVEFSHFFVSISNATSYPLFTFLSAGIVNVFVPSGGGQWAVQGPIIVQAAGDLGLSLPKSILAMAYGDQLTNMLQPFWALPLLGITGLKAREILPYTLYLLVLGGIIFVGALLFF